MRAATVALCASAAALSACGAGPEQAAQAPLPAPAPQASATRLPPELARLRAEADRLLPGGAPAYRERLRALRGRPVVVNKWASWCPPCRAEFPFLRSQAARRASEVAFLGVDSQDAREDAEAFLREQRPGFPSYEDPDLEVAKEMRALASFPTTAFYDSRGRLAYVKQGGYATERRLAEDIERYAR